MTKVTLLEQANYVERLADEFNTKTKRSLVNLQPGSHDKNVKLLREMVDESIINADRVVEIICRKY